MEHIVQRSLGLVHVQSKDDLREQKIRYEQKFVNHIE